ncbi:MAG TPA: thiolase [Rhodospirillaceae bacterium]|nr:thiolase [Rhodospirillaceae bacterium]
MAWIRAIGETEFGRIEGEDTLSLMAKATDAALANGGLRREYIDGLVVGYSHKLPHIMIASLFAEYYGLHPTYCHGVSVGGATGSIMVMLANRLVDVGQAKNVLVLGGENRLNGKDDTTLKTLASCGHPDFEDPFGLTIPAYYAFMASAYMNKHGISESDLAVFSVLMRSYASKHPKAHKREPITVDDVLASRPISEPLKLLDCCLISDGGCAIVVSTEPGNGKPVRIAGAAQTHPYQHVIAATRLAEFDSSRSLDAALKEAGVERPDIEIAGIYDSYSITLLAFLEELGLVEHGKAADACRSGMFGPDGRLPINTHGGLMSFGHSGIAGGLMHVNEVYRQMAGLAGDRQVGDPSVGLIHGEGGIFSSQVSLILRQG